VTLPESRDRNQATAPTSGARIGASYRDPAGFVFSRDGVVYRQINPPGIADYDCLVSSGLYRSLSDAGDLIRHAEVDRALSLDYGAARVIRPDRVPFVSYPYEWCFGQLKDAALLTLRLQSAAIGHGMSLKDATPFNVAFHRGRPVLIDTLSFTKLQPAAPWVAYRQFCELFLAPLALMSCTDVRLGQLLRSSLDGVPLDLASRLLPIATRLRSGLLIHLHLHGAAQRRMASRARLRNERRPMTLTALSALIDSLQRTIRSLKWTPAHTTWGDYYDSTNYSATAMSHKRELVSAALERLRPASVWDLGANDGTFSRLASERGIRTVAFDVDPAAVEKNYRRVVASGESHLLPVLFDLINPSPAVGWANAERDSLAARGPADLALALALVHHLAIAHNVPLLHVADYFASIGRALIIEFVPREDSQVQRMLASREDIFGGYTKEAFEAAFARRFLIEASVPVRESDRTLYVMRRLAP
jgi:hypothetical protein